MAEATGIQNYYCFLAQVALGKCDGYSLITKFGRAPNGAQQTITDIWDLSNATPTQQIWVAPTQPRIHAIVSANGGDNFGGGVGANTIRIFGLKDWDTAEVTEDIEMNGTTPVNTVNAYVIIHRMQVLTKGDEGPNKGAIKATAATDNTITATILAGEGQTQMAIFGIPSTQTALIMRFYCNMNKGTGANVSMDVFLKVNPEPQSELTKFLTKHTFGLIRDGSSAYSILYAVPKVIAGPAIIKVQAIASADDIDASGGFDILLVDKN